MEDSEMTVICCVPTRPEVKYIVINILYVIALTFGSFVEMSVPGRLCFELLSLFILYINSYSPLQQPHLFCVCVYV